MLNRPQAVFVRESLTQAFAQGRGIFCDEAAIDKCDDSQFARSDNVHGMEPRPGFGLRSLNDFAAADA